MTYHGVARGVHVNHTLCGIDFRAAALRAFPGTAPVHVEFDPEKVDCTRCRERAVERAVLRRLLYAAIQDREGRVEVSLPLFTDEEMEAVYRLWGGQL